MNVHGLFPTPVAVFELGRELSEFESDLLLNQPDRANTGNTTSLNNKILDSLSDIKEFCQNSIDKYFSFVQNPKNDVGLKISQSWVNYTKPGQFHHKHSHPNSLISGVFYVKAKEDSDRIYFYKDEYKQIKFTPKDWSIWNSDSWWLTVKTGQLIIFPSSLTHMVDTVKGEDTRVSLSFNTFPIGHIGEDAELTGLILKV